MKNLFNNKSRLSKTAYGLATGLVLSLSVSGQSQAGSETNFLNVGIAASDAGRLDPHLSATTIDKAVFGWMFSGLVRFTPGTASPNTIEPDLAKSWLGWCQHLH